MPNLIQNVFAAAWLVGTTTFSIKTKSGQTFGNRAKTDQFFWLGSMGLIPNQSNRRSTIQWYFPPLVFPAQFNRLSSLPDFVSLVSPVLYGLMTSLVTSLVTSLANFFFSSLSLELVRCCSRLSRMIWTSGQCYKTFLNLKGASLG